jgi:hypothetical protein
MKQLLIILIGILIASPALSQSDTEKSNTFVCIPEEYALKALIELKDYDLVKEENVALQDQITNLETYVKKKEADTKSLVSDKLYWQNSSLDKDQYLESYKMQLDVMARKNTNKNKLLKTLAIIAVGSLTLNAIVLR